MLLSTRIRLYPTREQQNLLSVQFGHARWVWNDALALTRKSYQETGKGLTFRSISARLPILKKELGWLADADSQVLQQALQNLAAAFENFFHKRSGYPRFKSRHDRQSIQYPQRVKFGDKHVFLPKVGWVKAILHRAILGSIKTVTVMHEMCGHYYASILVDDNTTPPTPIMPKGGHFTGVDLGLTDFAVTSAGSHFPNPRHLAKHSRNLARKQRKLARKQKGSRSREKAKRLVARIHERIKNARKDFLHKLSRRLVSENQALAVEDLSVKGMVRGLNLGKAISDAGWSTFTYFCQYKAERDGKWFVRTARFFPSSKTCSCCGIIRRSLPLKVRAWTCEGCSAVHDRDENASKNISREADRMLLAGVPQAARGTRATAGGGSVNRRGGLAASRVVRSREAGSRAS